MEATKTDPQPSDHFASRLLFRIALGIGFLVIALGLGWGQIAPENLFWSEQDAQEYAAAAEAAHNPAKASDPEAAQLRYEAARQKFDRAKQSHRQTGRRLLAVGALIATVGLIGTRMQL